MLTASLTETDGSADISAFNVAMTLGGANGRHSRWTDAWSAGHAVSVVRDIPTVADLVDRLAREYHEVLGARPHA